MSLLQCPKKLHLEIHQPELVTITPAQQAVFDLGHAVGDVAIALYGGEQGTYIEYGDLSRAVRQTRKLLDGKTTQPVFEATLEYQDVLVREDILLPAGDSWRVVEIKASTSVKDQYLQDCAIQAWVHQGAGYPLAAIALGYVDNQFVYPGEGNYEGLLIEKDLTAQVLELLPSVPVWVEQAKQVVAGPEPDVSVGQHCYAPYECPFVAYCWPSTEDAEYPVQGLKGGRNKLGEFVDSGYYDIRDVPLIEISSPVQTRIARVTRSGEPEILPDAGQLIRALEYPRYYLDFETVGPPIPLWPGTRPYEALPFQYSCHIEQADGSLEQVEFLDLSGEAPMRALAERLIGDLGDHGPVLMYTTYEQTVITGLLERFPDLSRPLTRILERLVDLHPVTKQGYYHPDMLGSWSIKDVLPTIAPELDYALLEGINDGTAAARAYLEAIQPAADPAAVDDIRNELLTYCRHDTLAMVRLAQFFTAH